MTREEAIDVLKHNYPSSCYEDLCKAVDMAIEALEQPEIIHCRECKHSHMTYDGECKYCDIWFPDEKCYMDGDYFCASAERREEGEQE